MKSEQNRSYYIDFLKFIFSFIIVVYHSHVFSSGFGHGIFNHGYYAVDFYFIVTGYLMMNSIYKEKEPKESIGEQTFTFIKNKIKKLLPNLIFSFIIGYILIYKDTLSTISRLFSDFILSEFLQLSILDYPMSINTSWWYISSMIIVLMLLYPFAKKKKDFSYLICPIIIVFSIAYIRNNNISVNDPIASVGIFKNGFYKALIFIPLGAICYEFSNYVRNLNLNQNKRILISIFETLSYMFLIYNMHFLKVGSIFIAVLFTINIAITFSNQSYIAQIFKSNVWQKLGQFGFIMFLNNCAIRKVLLTKNYGLSYKKMLLVFVIIVITISLIQYIMVEIFWNENKKRKLKKKKS